jgi:hypothetical protein
MSGIFLPNYLHVLDKIFGYRVVKLRRARLAPPWETNLGANRGYVREQPRLRHSDLLRLA